MIDIKKDVLVVYITVNEDALGNDYVEIDLAQWDSFTAAERYNFVYTQTEYAHMNRGASFELFTDLMSGKFALVYVCDSGIDLTVAELQAAGLLVTKWEAYGFDSEDAWDAELADKAQERLNA